MQITLCCVKYKRSLTKSRLEDTKKNKVSQKGKLKLQKKKKPERLNEGSLNIEKKKKITSKQSMMQPINQAAIKATKAVIIAAGEAEYTVKMQGLAKKHQEQANQY